MIGYVDASALGKLLLRDEEDSEVARQVIGAMDMSFTSRIAYPEARAALAAARRAGRLTSRDHSTAVRDLDRAMASFRIVELHPALARAAGDVAERFALRALDATTPLLPDPARDEFPIARKLESAGPVTEETEYATGGVRRAIKSYPAADRLLRLSGLVVDLSDLAVWA